MKIKTKDTIFLINNRLGMESFFFFNSLAIVEMKRCFWITRVVSLRKFIRICEKCIRRISVCKTIKENTSDIITGLKFINTVHIS